MTRGASSKSLASRRTLGDGDPASRAAPAWGRNLWLSLICGIVFATMMLSPGFVSGYGSYWNAPFGDTATAEIGWFYYAQDAWRVPVFSTPTHNTPEGGGIYFADAIPLIALPAKLAYHLFWPTGSPPPIYMGLWVWLCLALQAVAASRLLIGLGVVDPSRHASGVVLFCCAPILMLMSAHHSLLCHFWILLALDAYVRAKRYSLSRGEWVFACLLPALSLLTQPYVAVMATILVAVVLLDQWWNHRINLRGSVLWLVLVGVTCTAVIFASGLGTVASSNFGDYGTYSLNLLSPWVPFAQSTSGKWLGLRQTTPTLPGGSQWEGGAWIGLGVALLLVASIPALYRLRVLARVHAILLLVLAGVIAFAVTNRIGIGSYELDVPLPRRVIDLLSTFRTSGRFVWVPVYVLMAAVIAYVARSYRTRTSIALLVLAGLLQFVDVYPMQASIRTATARESRHTIHARQWAGLLESHTRLFQFPSFACGGLFGDRGPTAIYRELEINFIAARMNRPSNSAYLSRPNKDCERENHEAVTDWRTPGTLYLYRNSTLFREHLREHGVDFSDCGVLDDVVICSRSLPRIRMLAPVPDDSLPTYDFD